MSDTITHRSPTPEEIEITEEAYAMMEEVMGGKPAKKKIRMISPNTPAIQTTTDGGCYRTTGYTNSRGGLRRCTPEGKIIPRNRMSKKQRRQCRAKLREMGVHVP